ncbi:MAG: lipopolysaccharide transport periplasmic protein LptA [Nitrospiraceae bacterium]|nr:MAG: lipopolysaccharide transport periplasmic protein LptA [Nitrospiraceae bacterium]
MLKLFSIVNYIFVIFILNISVYASEHEGNKEKQPIVITSETLTADNRDHTAIFENSVVAKTDDFTIYSDRMTVYSDEGANAIKKIHATGHVKVYKSETVLFADEAEYFADEEKIIFTGSPRAVQKGNVITGSEIIFFLEDERAIVQKSRVVLKNKKELN